MGLFGFGKKKNVSEEQEEILAADKVIMEQIQDDDEVYTFNKSAGKKSDILYFSAIDINKIKVDDGSGNKRTYPPKIYNQNESPSVLWPYGFSVHYIGKNIDSFKFVGNNNGDLQYFLLQE